MTICFKNQSEHCIDIYIDKSHIILPCNESYEYTILFFHMPIEIKFSVSDKKTYMVGDVACCIYVSTIVLCDFSDLSNVTLNIKNKINKFQNYTIYQYLTIDYSELYVLNKKHIFDSLEPLQNYVQGYRENKILYILKESLIDTAIVILEEFLVSVLLVWVFSWKVALSFFLVVFLLGFVANVVKIKIFKSKHRILNWAKDTDSPDDIEYLIENIDKYCN